MECLLDAVQDAGRVYSATTGNAAGAGCDQTVAVNGFCGADDYPEHLRRIRFNDPGSGKTLVFLSSNTTWLPLIFAAPCK